MKENPERPDGSQDVKGGRTMRFLGRWKELYCGCSDQESARICALLDAAGIPYRYRAKCGHAGAAASGWMRFGSFGKYPAGVVMQYVDVRRQNLEIAKFLLEQAAREG